MIITVGTSKGGVGKSTIACNLAVAAAQDDKSVLLIDADVQNSSIDFRAIRQTDDIKAMAITTATLHKDLQDFKFDLILIDCGGRDSAVFRSAILAADKLIIPILPSVFDIWAAEDTLNIYQDAVLFNEDLTAHFVLNTVMPRTIMTKELVAAIEEQKVPVLKSKLGLRVDFKNSLLHGKGVIETAPKSKAAAELNSLYREIMEDI